MELFSMIFNKLEKPIDSIVHLRKKLVPDFARRSEDLCSCR